jgi:hypothetical protein
MRPVPIRFDQGLNMGESPDALKPGELRLARNSYYRPESSGLRKIWGRSLFGSFGSAGIAGLEFIQFRSAGAFLVGAAGTTLATAPVGTTGSFTTRKTLASTAGRMEAAYYNGSDRAYIFDGVNTPQVWTGTGNTRDLGLLSPGAPTVSILANGGTLYPTGTTFQYAFTEYDPTLEVESAPSTVTVESSTATGDTFKVTLPARVNTVTKFRVYRTQDGGSVFYLLAEIASQTVVSYYYDGTNTDAGAPASTNNAVWAFDSVDDIFLSTRPTLPMVGSPLAGNYITVNGTVPNGDIICMFENSLLVAGIPSFPQDIYYSQSDKPEQFSPVHFLREENARGDKVSGMGVANDRLLAFTLNSIFRHDTLPRVTDPGFGVGLASRQLVTDDHGCVAKRSVVNYGVGAPNNRLFYLSSRGPFATDGYQTIPLGQDLNWDSSLLNFDAMNLSIARAFPKYFVIVLMVPSASSTTNDIAFIYHYHPVHMKENGIGKWTGPIHMRAGAATVAHQVNTETRLFTGDTASTGNVYLEDQGSTDASLYENADGRILWEVETGDQNLGTETSRKRVGRVFLSLDGTADGAPSVEYALSKRDQLRPVTMSNISTQTQAADETIGTSSVDRPKTRTYRGGVWNSGTHVRVKISENVAGTDRSISSVEAEVEHWGKQVG